MAVLREWANPIVKIWSARSNPLEKRRGFKELRSLAIFSVLIVVFLEKATGGPAGPPDGLPGGSASVRHHHGLRVRLPLEVAVSG